MMGVSINKICTKLYFQYSAMTIEISRILKTLELEHTVSTVLANGCGASVSRSAQGGLSHQDILQT